MIASAPEKQFASESGHFYWPDGRPCYEVPNKSKPGEMRGTTVRDARNMGLYPSVSTILKVMGKGDALTNWVKKKVAEVGATYPFVDDYHSQEEKVQWILDSAEEVMTRQREQGTKDHGEVEDYFRQVVLWEDGPEKVRLINARYTDSRPVEAVLRAFDEMGIAGQRIASEKSFAHPMGYGGKIDVSGLEENWIVDFKFVDRLEKKLDRFDKCIQGAAYLVGRYGSLDRCRFANIFIETQEYSFLVREWTQEELQKGWRVFSLLHALWCEINDYHPKPLT